MKSKIKFVLGVFVVSILIMTIGYAAFSTGLNILSSAYVNPNSEDFSIVFSSESNRLSLTGVQYEKNNNHIDVGTPVIDNTSTESPTISGLTANFIDPGDSVTYTFYTLNNGEYDAYLTKLIFDKLNDNSIKKCTAGDGTSSDLVNKACSGIEMYVNIENINEPMYFTTNINNHILRKGASEEVQVTIRYKSGSDRADGPFSVSFGDIKLIYATVDDSSINDSYSSVSDDENYVELNAMGGSVNQTGIYLENGDTYNNLPEPVKDGYTFEGWYFESSYVNKVYNNSLIELNSSGTLYAKWEAQTFNVTLNYNDESMPDEVITVSYGDAYDLPQPAKVGYVFSGWYNRSDFLNARKISNGDMVDLTSDTILYAKWDKESYNVNFVTGFSDLNLNNIDVYYNSPYNKLKVLYKSGYTFLGWYLEDKFENKVENSTIVTKTTNHTLYAKWEANSYTLTFNSNGGTGINETMSVTYDSTYGQFPSTQRTGYTFLGWYASISGNDEIVQGSTVKITSDLTLYAHWIANEYTVNFDVNLAGATVGVESKQVTYGDEYGELPEPTKEGYTFNGWFDNEDGGNQITDKTIFYSESDITLYGHWTNDHVTSYTVYHWQQDLNGDASLHNDSNYTLVSTESNTGVAGTQVAATVNNYTGFTSPEEETITLLDNESNEVNYYYKRDKYLLTVNKSDGISNISSQRYYYQEDVYLDYVVDLGYTFSGISGDFDTNRFIMPASDASVSISATPITYNLSYELNGGSSVNYPSKYNSASVLQIDAPNKVGYRFQGWNITNNLDENYAKWGYSSSNVDMALHLGDVVKGTNSTDKLYFRYLSLSEGANITFNANWTVEVYSISFDSNGGNEVGSTLSVTYDGIYGDLPEPTRVGYTFDGWYTSKTGGTKVVRDTTVTESKNHTLYAHWIVNNYDVELTSDTGGVLSESLISIPYSGSSTVIVTTNPNYNLLSFNCSDGYSSSISEKNENTNEYVVTINNLNIVSGGSCNAEYVRLTGVGDEVAVQDERFYIIGSTEDKYVLLAKYNLNKNGTEQSDVTSSNYYNPLCKLYYYDQKDVYWFNNKTKLLDDINDTDKNEERAVGMLKVWAYAESLGGEGRLLTKDEAIYLRDNLNVIYRGSYAVDGYLQYYLSTVYPSADYPIWVVRNSTIGTANYNTYNGYEGVIGRNNFGIGLRPVLEINKSLVTLVS